MEVLAQWVVRLPDRVMLLQRPVREIRVFSTDEVLQFKTYYGSDDTKSRIERQHDINVRQAGVTFAYWVILFPPDCALEVLCCTVQRETAERILDALHMSLFTHCGDNTLVDFRQLLAADLAASDITAIQPTAGRFVDLGDGESGRPAVVVGSVDAAEIPVVTIGSNIGVQLSRRDSTPEDRNAFTMGQVLGQLWQPAGGIGLRSSDTPAVAANAGHAMSIDSVVSPARLVTDNTVQAIGRGVGHSQAGASSLTPHDRARIESQLQAAIMRQEQGAMLRPESGNRNPEAISAYQRAAREAIGIPAANTLMAREERRRANPMAGLDE